MGNKSNKNQSLIRFFISILNGYKGKFSLIIILSIIQSLMSFFLPLVNKNLVDLGILENNFSTFKFYLFLLLFLSFSKEIIEYIDSKLLIVLSNEINLNLNDMFLKHTLRLKFEYFNNMSGAKLYNQIVGDIYKISSTIQTTLTTLLFQLFLFVSGIFGLLIINKKLIIFVLLIIPFKVLFVYFFSNIQEKNYTKHLLLFDKFGSFLMEIAKNIANIKLLNLYCHYETETLNIQKDIKKQDYKLFKNSKINQSVDTIVNLIITVIIFYIGFFEIQKNRLTYGGLISYISYMFNVINPVTAICSLGIVFSEFKPSLKRFYSFMNLEKEQVEGLNITKMGKLHSISFKNVSFKYPGTDILILNNCNLELE